MQHTFPLKHWLATLAISPAIWLIYESVTAKEFVVGAGTIYFVAILVGAVISLPAFALHWFIYKQLLSLHLTDLNIRIILVIAASLSAIVAFQLIGGSFSDTAPYFYVAGTSISGWLFPVRG